MPDLTSPAPGCRICGDSGLHPTLVLHEQMFGSNDAFDYFMCRQCNCLQIRDPHIDVSRYYPSSYYSFASRAPSGGLGGLLHRWRDRAALGSGSPLGRALLARKPNPPVASLALVAAGERDRILDVGCGSGTLLRSLRALGFLDLTGVDPHIAASTEVDPHLRLVRSTLDELDGTFDLVMFHHSLEHIADQHSTFDSVRRVLAPGGRCLVRVPVVPSAVWREYGVHWVQADAPRHFYLHSRDSMALLARQAGLHVRRVVYDSNEFQFWGSEAFRQGIPLFDIRSGRPTSAAGALAARHRASGRRRARELNERGEGDQAVFILSHDDGTAA